MTVDRYISTNIQYIGWQSTNISVNYQSTIDRLSANYRSTIDRQSTNDCWLSTDTCISTETTYSTHDLKQVQTSERKTKQPGKLENILDSVYYTDINTQNSNIYHHHYHYHHLETTIWFSCIQATQQHELIEIAALLTFTAMFSCLFPQNVKHVRLSGCHLLGKKPH